MTFIYGTSKTETIDGPVVSIHCPVCGDEAPAATYETRERIKLYFVPVTTQVERHVVCTICGANLLTKLSFDEMYVCLPEQSEQQLYQRISIVVKTFAVASFVTFVVPFFGAVLGIIAMVLCRRSRKSWPYRLARLSVILTVVLWGAVLVHTALVALKVL